jgi:hypothetical protein
VTIPRLLRLLGLTSSEKQIPQVVEKLGRGENQREVLDPRVVRVKQAL